MNEEKIKQLDSLVEEIMNHREKKFIPGETPILTGCAVYDYNEINAIIHSLFSGWWAVSNKGTEFENRLAEYIGNKKSVFVNSGSSASLLALNAIRNERTLTGGEIITPACTFPTTVNPIIQLGFKPAFVDIDKTLNLSPEAVYSAINEKTVGMFVPHTLGNPCKIEEITEIAKERNLFLIEDCCDALGADYNRKKCGSFGEASTFSFYPAHGITTGEGGAVSTNSSKLERIIRSLRDWGKDCWCQSEEKNPDGACKARFSRKINGILYDHRYIYSQIGYNLKPLELQAAMGIEQLKRLDGFSKARKRNYSSYKEKLACIPEIELPEVNPKAEPVLFGLPIIIKDPGIQRDDLLKFLNNSKIGTRLLFAGNVLHQPAYKNIDYSIYGKLDYTDKIARDCFWIGIHQGLTEEMVDYVASKFKEYFKR